MTFSSWDWRKSSRKNFKTISKKRIKNL
ncbi:hypothetical protein FH602_17350 [Leptospira kirschneri]|nr:hypothetical protein [Leptospira kirschneri]UML82264.1 hypothetical protein FH602_17350 [Leptospira kirschneri]